MRLMIAAFATALMVTAAHSQAANTPGMPGGSRIGDEVSKANERAEANSPKQKKTEDKAYSSALRNLPDKQYDPWHGVR